MPQADAKHTALMEKWFGGVDDYPVIQFLESHGYTLTKQWTWIRPTPSHTISDDEWSCIIFLHQEWDFGGLAADVST